MPLLAGAMRSRRPANSADAGANVVPRPCPLGRAPARWPPVQAQEEIGKRACAVLSPRYRRAAPPSANARLAAPTTPKAARTETTIGQAAGSASGRKVSPPANATRGVGAPIRRQAPPGELLEPSQRAQRAWLAFPWLNDALAAAFFRQHQRTFRGRLHQALDCVQGEHDGCSEHPRERPVGNLERHGELREGFKAPS